VPAQRIGDIVAGKRAITADTDLRLRAQAAHDTEVAERKIGASLAGIRAGRIVFASQKKAAKGPTP